MLAGAGGSPGAFRAGAGKALLHFLPKIRRHDRQLGNIVLDPLGFGSHDPAPTFASGNSDPLRLIPCRAPDVSLVTEHRADRRVAPPATALVTSAAIVRSRDGLLVQHRRDLLERGSVGELAKDLQHNLRLGLIGSAGFSS